MAACGGGDSVPTEPEPEVELPLGRSEPVVLPDTLDIVALVEQLKDAMPGRDASGYRPPLPFEQLSFIDALDSIQAGRIESGDRLLARHEYDAVWTVEATTGDSLLVIMERSPLERGRGTFVFNGSRFARFSDIHVNHPVFDVNTHRLGARIYQLCQCRWLLLAGTHRFTNPDGTSDIAREQGSIFQLVHEKVAAGLIQTLSIHGFDPADHGSPTSEADMVISDWRMSPGRWAPGPGWPRADSPPG